MSEIPIGIHRENATPYNAEGLWQANGMTSSPAAERGSRWERNCCKTKERGRGKSPTTPGSGSRVEMGDRPEDFFIAHLWHLGRDNGS